MLKSWPACRHCRGASATRSWRAGATCVCASNPNPNACIQVLACLPALPWRISDAELARRRDLRAGRIFSIDPPTAKDLDDALSVERLPNGGLRVGVHIADVAHFIAPGSALDRAARERATSTYLVSFGW